MVLKNLPPLICYGTLFLFSQYSVKYKHEKESALLCQFHFACSPAHDEGIWCCAWGKHQINGTEYVVTGALDNGLKLWKWMDDHLEFFRACEGHRLGVISVDISANGTMAASSSQDNQIRFWDLESGRLLKTYEGNPADTWTIAFSPDSRFVATGSHTGCVNMIGIESGRKESAIQLDGKFIYSLAYSPDGTRLAAGAINGIVSICDLQTGNVRPLDGHAMPVRALAFSPDGQFLASTSDDKQIKVFDVHDGRNVISALNGHKGWVVSVQFSPDMRHLASASTDGTVRVWDFSSKQEKHAFAEHEGQVWCNRYSPCGTKLMSVGDDRAIFVYNV
ncbi:WD repeat-containing protein 61 [Fasciolopsis buskii]|uniref:WD repeat-containing protein 61 n=1 Tax=Fasciolopsis buskii TaxID=27845 RepID=A0A8E0RNK3_9TREM|nr:WD repeat-containing protein 61 [Fasciolopsis buski]